MKENTTNLPSRITKWLTLAVAVVLISQSARATTVYDNSVNRETNNVGDSLYFAQGGYEFGDEVVLSPVASAYLTNFTFEYYGSGLSGATARLRIYAMNGTAYGTNFSRPGDVLYDSGAFSISDGISGGFGTITVNRDNTPGFGVPVSSNFAWTVEFANVGAATAGLALYDSPVTGTDYAQYWEHSGAGNSWVYRAPDAGQGAINFGALAQAQSYSADVTAPTTLSYISPADNLRWYESNSPSITLTGACKDNAGGSGIALVLYQLNSDSYRPAVLSNTNTTWSAAVNLNVGLNTYRVKAIDRNGNVKVGTGPRKVTFVVMRDCSLTFAEGNGSGSTKGVVTSAGFATTTTNLEIGKTYSLEVVPTKVIVPAVSATAAINTFWYSNTVASSVVSTSTITASKFTFVMQTNMSLLLNCVANRFIDARGEYNGLFDAGGISQDSAGYITLKTDSKRGFSGNIYVAGENLAISGLFDLDGNANSPVVKAPIPSGGTKIAYSKKQTLTNTVRLTLNFDPIKTVTGTVSNNITGVVSDIVADKYVWATNNPATNYSGTYTMMVPSVLSNTNGPSGWGYASVIISTNGLITMKGLTADGQKFEQKTKLSKDGNWPLFAQNAADGNTNKLLKGSVWGWITVAPTNDLGTERVSGDLTWIRTAFPTNWYYPVGFTNVSTPHANRYVNGKVGTAYTNYVVQLTAGTTNGVTDGNIILAGDSLTGSTTNISGVLIPCTASIDGKMAVNKIQVGTMKTTPWKASVLTTPASGVVSGSLVNPNGGATTKFYGIALQDESKVYGAFNSTNGYQSGSFIIQP